MTDLRISSNRTKCKSNFFSKKRNVFRSDSAYLMCSYENNQKYMEGREIRAGISRALQGALVVKA